MLLNCTIICYENCPSTINCLSPFFCNSNTIKILVTLLWGNELTVCDILYIAYIVNQGKLSEIVYK